MNLSFLPCQLSVVDQIDDRGLAPETGSRIFPSLAEARATRPEAILVLGTPFAAEDSFSPLPSWIDRHALLNLDPYRPPKSVTAAGGIVVRRDSDAVRVVLIHRRGVWDLPKGKRDRGESIPDCAVREVKEELGIADVRIASDIGTTIHGYPDKKHYAVKTTHWFVMRTSASVFVPQAAEQIEAVRWMTLDDAIAALGFDGLRRLLSSHVPMLIEAA